MLNVTEPTASARDPRELEAIVVNITKALKHCREWIEEPTLLTEHLELTRKEAIAVAWRRACALKHPNDRENAFLEIYMWLNDN